MTFGVHDICWCMNTIIRHLWKHIQLMDIINHQFNILQNQIWGNNRHFLLYLGWIYNWLLKYDNCCSYEPILWFTFLLILLLNFHFSIKWHQIILAHYRRSASASRYDELFAYFLVDWHWTYYWTKNMLILIQQTQLFSSKLSNLKLIVAYILIWFSFKLKFDQSQYR